ncbi:hypothetical protein Q9314_15240 [Shinella sumterensis]|nr:hypothetical protein Q9314_15240 [Shinella sumterensis]
MVIDINSRERLDAINPTAAFEILSWEDPVMRGTPYDPNRFVIDGSAPLDVALKIKAMLDDCPEADFTILGLNDPGYADMIAETGRVIFEGLVPLVSAEQAQSICNAHNAKLAKH